ncbi:MAG: hypothetical protein P794_02030 [Epsilonproteobacteria bacterium (ex Lamellibrachia satsuma)]|nr:MAG: hypothetical protein P794_02030 [Epsilonproteobacteria bacterium (ex Lamellibrachia satsuma)]
MSNSHSGTAIKVENLGKKHLIKHEKQEPYKTFQDLLINSGKKIITSLNPFAEKKADDESTEEFWALKDVNFEINKGDKVGIIGRNGAGKSTLLKVLSRITEPTTGKIHINGRIASLLEVGTGFHPELTGRENIFLNGAILGMSRAEIKAKFDEIVAFAEVEKFLDTPVKRYSSGMYVRLAFSVAAHLEPEILVVDEVLAVGDVEFQKKCLGKMNDVAEEGRTVLFVSHNFASLKALCNKGILLNKGQVIMHSSLNDVVEQYSKLIEKKDQRFSPLIADSADITSIQLCNDKGKVLKHIDTDTDIYITLDYRIKRKGQINMVINLSKDGQFVFQSFNNFDSLFYTKKEPGDYRGVCHIPKQFLNNGQFTFSMTVFEENYSNPKVFLDVFSFAVEDGPSIRGDYFGGILGSVRPKLHWRTERL